MSSRYLIRLQQMTVNPGDPERNTETMLAALETARRDGVRLLVFPEMAIPGYLLGDAWERPAFLRDCMACGDIIRAAARDVTVIFGNVAVDPERRNEDGRVRKYNALFAAHAGRFVVPDNGLGYPFLTKTLMPNYREFDDSRYFYDTRKLAQDLGKRLEDVIVPLDLDGLRIGALVCEDAWDEDYTPAPARMVAEKKMDFLVLLNCSPFTFNKRNKRDRVFHRLARQLRRPVLVVNSVGLQDNGKTVYTFDGGTAAYDPVGRVLSGPSAFAEDQLTLAWPPDDGAWQPATPRSDTIEDLDRTLIYGIDVFLKRLGIRRVVVGASGGIDSAVVAALHRRILAPRDLLLVTMPSRYTSRRTLTAARRLAASLGCLFTEIPIEPSVELTRDQLEGLALRTADGQCHERLQLSDALLENVQARDRSGRILAAVAAAFGGVFTCNANKAEMTVGYTTLYGDLGGYLAPIGDLWKEDVYRLARYMNHAVFKTDTIPGDCFSLPPSAELSRQQDVEQGLGDPLHYPYHDALFRSWVETWERCTPEDILAWYLEGVLERKIGCSGSVNARFPTARDFVADLERWWNAYQGIGVAKRIQAPPVLAVSRRAFGFDHREAQLGPRYTRRYRELKNRLNSEDA